MADTHFRGEGGSSCESLGHVIQRHDLEKLVKQGREIGVGRPKRESGKGCISSLSSGTRARQGVVLPPTLSWQGSTRLALTHTRGPTHGALPRLTLAASPRAPALTGKTSGGRQERRGCIPRRATPPGQPQIPLAPAPDSRGARGEPLAGSCFRRESSGLWPPPRARWSRGKHA